MIRIPILKMLKIFKRDKRKLERLCGTSPDSVDVRLTQIKKRRWRKLGNTPPGTILQRVDVLQREQLGWPSCAGQTLAEGIDRQLPVNSNPVSAVSIWRDARRRSGTPISNISVGTTITSCIDSIIHRGWDDWVKGEDSDPVEMGAGAPKAGDDLRDELMAHDNKKRVTLHYRITSLDELDDALAKGASVAAGFGVRKPFITLKTGEVATRYHLGGGSNGHAMSIVGRIIRDGGRLYVVQNHWTDWGGCVIEGRTLDGYCIVDEEAVRSAWDLHAIVIR